MTFADDCTRVYTPHGKLAHLLEPGDQATAGHPVALCRRSPAPHWWLGTGSRGEYDKAKSLPLCARCARAAAKRGKQAPSPATHPAGEGPIPEGASPPSGAPGALPDGFPGHGRAAHPVPGKPAGAGCAPHAPSPPASPPAGGEGPVPGDGGPEGLSSSPGPGPASPGKAVPGLAGEDWRAAMRQAIKAGNAAQRRGRARPWAGKSGQPGYRPGSNSIPPAPQGASRTAAPLKAARRPAAAETGVVFRVVSPGLVRIVAGGHTVGHVNHPGGRREWWAVLYRRPAHISQPLPDMSETGPVLRSSSEDGHSLSALKGRVRERLAEQGPWWTR